MTERYVATLDLAPDDLGKLQNRGGFGSRDVEVLVQCLWVLHASDDALRQVTTVRVVTDLVALAKDVEWILALQDLLHKVWHDVAHRQLDIPGENLNLSECAAFSYTHAVERPDDCVRQLVLIPCGLGEVLNCQFLESIGRQRRRNPAFITLNTWPVFSALEHHRGTQVRHFLQLPLPVSTNCRITSRRHDSLIGCQKVIRVGMEVADATNQGCTGNQMVTIHQQLCHQVDIRGVTFDKLVLRVRVIALGNSSVLRIVVDSDNFMTTCQELLDDISSDETLRPG